MEMQLHLRWCERLWRGRQQDRRQEESLLYGPGPHAERRRNLQKGVERRDVPDGTVVTSGAV